MTDTTNQDAQQSGLDIDKLDALARAATPGPWIHDAEDNIIYPPHGGRMIEISCRSTDIGTVQRDNNASFIAAANPAAVRELIALARRAAPATGAQVAKATPELTVWHGSMPESNGKSNFTAVLMRKGGSLLDGIGGGFTIARSEYPDRVRYEADCVRYLIGELDSEPFILDYDAEKHSGYVAPATERVTEGVAQTAAARDVLAERRRQREVEGWTEAHDDKYRTGQLPRAAAAYALAGSSDGRTVGDELTPSLTERLWPWCSSWWKPSDKRRNLVKAAALILADIERLDRATQQPSAQGGEA